MKKILAYLLVLVSLMTLFCGTASAEEIYRTGTTGNYYQANVVVTNLTTGKSKEELIGIANWVVTVTCKYEHGHRKLLVPYPMRVGALIVMVKRVNQHTLITKVEDAPCLNIAILARLL